MQIFDVDIATKYGLESAIIFSLISQCTYISIATKEIYLDGNYWTELSDDWFKLKVPYLPITKVKKTIKKLIRAKLISQKGNLYTTLEG